MRHDRLARVVKHTLRGGETGVPADRLVAWIMRNCKVSGRVAEEYLGDLTRMGWLRYREDLRTYIATSEGQKLTSGR